MGFCKKKKKKHSALSFSHNYCVLINSLYVFFATVSWVHPYGIGDTILLPPTPLFQHIHPFMVSLGPSIHSLFFALKCMLHHFLPYPTLLLSPSLVHPTPRNPTSFSHLCTPSIVRATLICYLSSLPINCTTPPFSSYMSFLSLAQRLSSPAATTTQQLHVQQLILQQLLLQSYGLVVFTVLHVHEYLKNWRY